MSSMADPEMAAQIREQWASVEDLLFGCPASEDQPEPELNLYRVSGGSDVILVKGQPPQQRVYTRFRSWAHNGAKYIEKSQFSIAEDGYRVFLQWCLGPGDRVRVSEVAEGEDLNLLRTLP